jgi:hypothetical protein
MEVRCDHCDVLHWIEEQVTRSSQAHLRFTTCSCCGKVRLPPLAPPPPMLRCLLEGQTQEAKQFCDHIQMYNNAFVFTSVGARIDQAMVTHPQAPC